MGDTAGAVTTTDGSAATSSNSNRGNRFIERLNLDIGLTVKDCTPSSGLSYHLFVLWQSNDQEQEVLFKGPIAPRSDSANSRNPWAQHRTTASPPPGTAKSIEFEEAYSTVLQKNSECFTVANNTSSSNSSIWFQSRYPISNSVSSGKTTSTCLHSLLESIQNKPFSEAFEDFPNAERIDLAYQVAECGLMLLGTSWLSDIRSTQIWRLKNYMRQQHLFMLQVTEAAAPASAAIDELLCAVEPQTFMIGVLLAEIAIAEPVTGFKPYKAQDGRQKLALRVTRKNDQGQRQDYGMKVGAAVRKVNNCMGPAYSEAVEFCLRQSGISRSPAWSRLRGNDGGDVMEKDEAYKSLLKDFHQEVFVR